MAGGYGIQRHKPVSHYDLVVEEVIVTTRTFVELDSQTARKVSMASAACMLTSEEFVQLAVNSALAAAASKNASLATVLEYESF